MSTVPRRRSSAADRPVAPQFATGASAAGSDHALWRHDFEQWRASIRAAAPSPAAHRTGAGCRNREGVHPLSPELVLVDEDLREAARRALGDPPDVFAELERLRAAAAEEQRDPPTSADPPNARPSADPRPARLVEATPSPAGTAEPPPSPSVSPTPSERFASPAGSTLTTRREAESPSGLSSAARSPDPTAETVRRLRRALEEAESPRPGTALPSARRRASPRRARFAPSARSQQPAPPSS